MMLVKIAMLGERVHQLFYDYDRRLTVKEALAAAGITKKKSYMCRVNGENVRQNKLLHDGDTVILTPNNKVWSCRA